MQDKTLVQSSYSATINVPVEQGVSPFTVVLNWQSELKN
jgi:hypothetical protein